MKNKKMRFPVFQLPPNIQKNQNIYVKIVDNTDSIIVEIRDEGFRFTKEKLFGMYETLSATPFTQTHNAGQYLLLS